MTRSLAAGDLLHKQQSPQSVEVFQQDDTWRLYTKAVELDLMSQSELFGELHRLLAVLAKGCTPLRVLDLGCGDCSRTAAALCQAGLPLASFTGVDVSAPPLAAAAANLASLPPSCTVSLVAADIAAFVEGASQQFDLVISAYAVHHLSLAGKAEFLWHLGRRLRPGGLFVLIDCFRAEGEGREGWLARARRRIDTGLHDGVSDEGERSTLWGHVSGHDYPEDLPTWRLLAVMAGFSRLHCARVDRDNLFGMLVMRK